MEDISNRLKSGDVVVLRDAFRPAFAEMVYSELQAKNVAWELNEAYFEDGYHHKHHNVYDQGMWSARLNSTLGIFSHPDSTALMAELSGRDCTGARRVGIRRATTRYHTPTGSASGRSLTSGICPKTGGPSGVARCTGRSTITLWPPTPPPSTRSSFSPSRRGLRISSPRLAPSTRASASPSTAGGSPHGCRRWKMILKGRLATRRAGPR